MSEKDANLNFCFLMRFIYLCKARVTGWTWHLSEISLNLNLPYVLKCFQVFVGGFVDRHLY